MGAPLAIPEPSTIERTIPFDYSFQFALTGERDTVLNGTIEISIEAPFVASSIGYGFVPKIETTTFGLTPAPPAAAPAAPAPVNVRLDDVTFRDFNHSALMAVLRSARGRTGSPRGVPAAQPDLRSLIGVMRQRFRINPEVLPIVLARPDATLDEGILSRLFQIIAEPEGVQFTYALFDEASGREFQNAPILNTAGLGRPDGKRPFRELARPIVFAPRSTVRLQITELSDIPGDLYVSLHGYRALPPVEQARQRAQRRERMIRGGRGR